MVSSDRKGKGGMQIRDVYEAELCECLLVYGSQPFRTLSCRGVELHRPNLIGPSSLGLRLSIYTVATGVTMDIESIYKRSSA